jgi:hypothetical protein
MKAAQAIEWIANHLYLNGVASSKKAAFAAAERIVEFLVDSEVLILDDLKPSKGA